MERSGQTSSYPYPKTKSFGGSRLNRSRQSADGSQYCPPICDHEVYRLPRHRHHRHRQPCGSRMATIPSTGITFSYCKVWAMGRIGLSPCVVYPPRSTLEP